MHATAGSNNAAEGGDTFIVAARRPVLRARLTGALFVPPAMPLLQARTCITCSGQHYARHAKALGHV